MEKELLKIKKLFKNSQIACELIKSSNLPAGKGRLVAFFLVNSAAIHSKKRLELNNFLELSAAFGILKQLQ